MVRSAWCAAAVGCLLALGCGAPSDHNFDTLTAIRAMPEHIDMVAAAGAAHVNTQMPPSGPMPTGEERRQLGEWLACGMP